MSHVNTQPSPTSSAIHFGILSIGTEITNGQILNRNSQWIAQQLSNLGFVTSSHLSVADDFQQILDALDFLKSRCTHLFVTGGLGPTKDDFTREVISKWTQRPLEFHEDSWTHVKERLQARGVPLREFQKQQCHYPRGSKVLKNSRGTAHAFYVPRTSSEFSEEGSSFSRSGAVKTKDVRAQNSTPDIWVLPGPPGEIEQIWKDHIDSDLRELSETIDRECVALWDTLGYGESEIAHRVEEVTEDCPFIKGYRVHLPYVEVKLIYPSSRQSEAHYWIQRIEETLKPMTVTREGKDVASVLIELLNQWKSVSIVDHSPQGLLMQRLAPALKKQKCFLSWDYQWKSSSTFVSRPAETPKNFRPQHIQLELGADPTGRGFARLVMGSQVYQTPIPSPENLKLLADRKWIFDAEMASLFWWKQLRDRQL